MTLRREQESVCGLVGDPIEHSLSPAMQNAALCALGIPWEYNLYPARDREEAELLFEEVRRGVFAGLNVTMPYKELAFAFCDSVSEAARIARGVNTLRMRDGELFGDNTDGRGLVRSLQEDAGVSAQGKKIIVLGTGPTARVIAFELGRADVEEVVIVSRDARKSIELAQEVEETLLRNDDISGGTRARVTRLKGISYEVLELGASESGFVDARVFDVVINATSLGMKAEDPSPIPAHMMSSSQVIFDVTYTASHTTAFIRSGQEAKATVCDGRGMLVEQGALSLALWTGIDDSLIPRDIMRDAVNAALA